MNQQRLNAIRERTERATQGPWKTDGIPYDRDDPVILGPDNQYIAQTVYDMQSTTMKHNVDADTEFIANARQDIPYLLHLVEELAKVSGQQP